MFSEMAGTYFVAGIMSGVVMLAAVAAEGRGAHLIRLWLTRGRESRRQLTRMRANPREILYVEMPRTTNEFDVVSQLGASEVRYAELSARLEERADPSASERPDAA